MNIFRLKKGFWIVLLIVFILSAILSTLDGRGYWLQGWIAYAVMLGIGALSTYALWKAVKPGYQVTRIALISFFLRLSAGVALVLLLPIVGYQNNSEHLAGYVYTDAFIRDGQAWNLAISTSPLSQAFSGQFTGDQYGGMLGLSAFIYRFISPDAHRPP